MQQVSAFFMQNIVFVYFFYGLAFFSLGLVVLLESSRASEFRFSRALRPLAWFGFFHGGHEWFEMFQVFAAHETGYVAGVPEEIVRVLILVASFLLLLSFGTRLLPNAEEHRSASRWQVSVLALIWLTGVAVIQIRHRPELTELLVAADVLSRYALGIPGSLLAAWVMLRERRDFHARGMSMYGRSLLWAALAFFVYGAFGQLFTRPSLIFPSQVINTALFLRTFGLPVQLMRGAAGGVMAVMLGRSLRAFEFESRIRLARANEARLSAQAEALEAQQRRADEVEALNVQLQVTARELSAMVRMASILASTMDLGRMLGDALYQIVHSVESACCCVVFLKRQDDGLELAGRYRRPNAPHPLTLPPLTLTVVRAVELGAPVGAGINSEVQAIDAETLRQGLTYRTIGVPLQSKSRLFGSLALSSLREDVPLGAAELSLLVAFSQQIATSIESARLYQVVQEREMQLEELVHQLVTAQEGERQRIARELHDETGQKLTALAMGLATVEAYLNSENRAGALELVRNLRDMSDQAIGELRNVMANLRPSLLDDLGLVPALRWYVQRFQSRHPGLAVSLKTEGSTARLPSECEIVLFRVAQEALTNVVRHARASTVAITLHRETESVRLDIVDDGVGFDLTIPAKHDQGGGWGLVGIQERVAIVLGRCEVVSQRGAGTRISVTIPLRNVEPANG